MIRHISTPLTDAGNPLVVGADYTTNNKIIEWQNTTGYNVRIKEFNIYLKDATATDWPINGFGGGAPLSSSIDIVWADANNNLIQVITGFNMNASLIAQSKYIKRYNPIDHLITALEFDELIIPPSDKISILFDMDLSHIDEFMAGIIGRVLYP